MHKPVNNLPPDPPTRSPSPRPSSRAVRLSFGPDLRLVFVAVPGAVLAALSAAVGSDPVQRFFSIIVTLVLAAVAAADLLFRPRLVVDADGVRVRSPFDRATLPCP